MQSIIECFSAFIACLGFAFIFRIHQHPRFAIIGSIGGALGWLVYLLASNFKSEISCYFLELFLDSFLNTLAISASLALAILIISTIFKVIKKLSCRKIKVNS